MNTTEKKFIRDLKEKEHFQTFFHVLDKRSAWIATANRI